MSDSSNRFKIKNTDFGFGNQEIGNFATKKAEFITKSISGSATAAKFRHIVKSTVTITAKKIVVFFNRLKWKVSRSIFMGRGIYFKYISNLSILVIVIFGTFVYLEFQGSSNQAALFASKYSKGAVDTEETIKPYAGIDSALDKQQKQLSITKYQVNSGDTLSSIAKKFSTPEQPISVDSIKWANRLKDDSLQPGTLLDIPPVSGTLHIVTAGETATDILKKYGKITDKSSEIEVFAALQQLTNDNVLDVKVEGEKKIPVIPGAGSRLIISGGVVIPAQPAIASKPQTNTKQTLPQPNTGAPTGYIWPVVNGIGTVTQYFTSARYGYGHTGIDIADFSGPLLVAIAPGTVISTGWENGGGGCVVRVRFDDFGAYKNMSGLYAHSRCNYLVSPGQRVAQGQALVNMGSTGRSTGTHVHFEMFQNGYFVNPASYIRR